MLKEFKEFAMRGSVVDLAVGVIIGAAFGKIVTSLVDDVLMPPIGKLVGHVDFKDLFLSLDGKSYADLVAAKAAHAVTLNYGIFLNTIVNFLIVAFCVFLCGAAGQSLDQEACCGGCSHNERVSTVRDDHSDCGQALRPLHCAASLTKTSGN